MPTDLDLLQGVWVVAALEADGASLPRETLSGARVEIKGGRFSGTGMGAVYEGTLRLNSKPRPRQIDMRFDKGPEAGNLNRGIYEIKRGAWRLCLATRGDARPTEFATSAGSGHALETLKRASGKAAPRRAMAAAAAVGEVSTAPSSLEGEWRMVSGVMNGVAMDESSVQWVRRINHGNLSTVMAGPQTMLKVEFSCDDRQSPRAIDYLNLAGANKGKRQQGIYALEGDLLKVCVAPPGAARPAGFASTKGDGRTFTVWTRA